MKPRIADVSEVIRALQRCKGQPSLNDWGHSLMLVGAGCSVTAGIPAAREVAKRCVVELCGQYSNGRQMLSVPDEALAWLKEAKHLPSSLDWSDAYGYLFSEHLTDPKAQQRVIAAAMQEYRGINWTHMSIGELVARGYTDTVLTTNFDLLILDGIIRTGMLPVVADGIEAIDRISPNPATPQVVHLHGSRHTYAPRNSAAAVGEPGDDIGTVASLYHLFREADVLLVIGYSGGEEAVMKLLQASASRLPDKAIYWVQHSADPDTLSGRAQAFLGSSRNGALVIGQDSDAFFRQVMTGLGIGSPTWMRQPLDLLRQQAEKIAAPDSAEVAAVLEEYREQLRTAAELLADSAATRSSFEQLYAKARAAALAGDHDTSYSHLLELSEMTEDWVLWDLLVEVADLRHSDKPSEETLDAYLSSATAAAARTDRQSEPARWLRSSLKVADARAKKGEALQSIPVLTAALADFTAVIDSGLLTSNSEEWGRVQNNMGNVEASLGHLTDNIDYMDGALLHYNSALSVHTRDARPLEWAQTQQNIGALQVGRANWDNGTESLSAALAACELASEIFTPSQVAGAYASTVDIRACTLAELATRTGNVAHLTESIKLHRELLESPIAQYLANIADVRVNLANSLARLSTLTNDHQDVAAALAAYDSAISQATQPGAKDAWIARAYKGRATLLSTTADSPGDVSMLRAAQKDWRQSLVLYEESRPLDFAQCLTGMGRVESRLGELVGDLSLMQRGVAECRQAVNVLKSLNPPAAPRNIVLATVALGTALLKLGARTREEEVLLEARGELSLARAGAAVQGWAPHEGSIEFLDGTILMELDLIRSSDNLLKEACSRFLRSAELFQSAARGVATAESHSALGQALLRWGRRGRDLILLKRALDAHERALAGLSRTAAPHKWAAAMSSIAASLLSIGEMEGSLVRLRRALEAYEESLEVRSDLDASLAVAKVKSDMSNVLLVMFDLSGDLSLIHRALLVAREALELLTKQTSPVEWAKATARVGYMQAVVGRQEHDAGRLREGIRLLRAALEVFHYDKYPGEWTVVQNNLGMALAVAGESEEGTAHLEDAIEAFRAAAVGFDKLQRRRECASSRSNLGQAMAQVAVRRGEDEALFTAVQVLEEAWAATDKESNPSAWVSVSRNLGNVLSVMAQKKGDSALAERAVQILLDAAVVVGDAGNATLKALLVENIELARTRGRGLKAGNGGS